MIYLHNTPNGCLLIKFCNFIKILFDTNTNNVIYWIVDYWRHQIKFFTKMIYFNQTNNSKFYNWVYQRVFEWLNTLFYFLFIHIIKTDPETKIPIKVWLFRINPPFNCFHCLSPEFNYFGRILIAIRIDHFNPINIFPPLDYNLKCPKQSILLSWLKPQDLLQSLSLP